MSKQSKKTAPRAGQQEQAVKTRKGGSRTVPKSQPVKDKEKDNAG